MNDHPYRIITNEPRIHPLIAGSFVFVPTAGMRLAPEMLVLEFFREIFFSSHYGEPTGTKTLNPLEQNEDGEYVFSNPEKAVLYALGGRRKKTKSANVQRFFAPVYPALSRSSWYGKNRERVIYNFFLQGPISQYLWSRGTDVKAKKDERDEIIDLLSQALIGNNSCLDDNIRDKDILSVAIRHSEQQIDREIARTKLLDKTGFSDTVFRTDHDELASRIFHDIKYICYLESQLPRMQWIQVLMAFLRFAMPMWLLAQMQITNLLHDWLLRAVDDHYIADSSTVSAGVAKRNRHLLRPTLTPTREVFEQIERYMKNRVELSVLIYCLEQVRPNEVNGRKLVMNGMGTKTISVDKLLQLTHDASLEIRKLERFEKVASGLNFRRFLTREGELFPAWRDPIKKGQGKNIDEFLRVMYRAEVGDEAGGYLLSPQGRGGERGFRVFPGQLLLKTITHLAASDKREHGILSGGGKLVLDDIERHFQQYGIDFSYAADARPLLMRELQAMGLLTGSPDAGSSVSVAYPY